MNLAEQLEYIAKNIGGLSIRQLPVKVTHTYDIRNYKEGDETFKATHKLGKLEREREYCRRYSYPQNGGCWLSQITNNTDSTVIWSIKLHNLAPTLEESLQLLIDNHNKEK